MAQQSEERVPYDLGDETVKEARERIYPGWWMFAQREGVIDTAPRYIVRPRDEVDRQIAYLVRPVGILAEIHPVAEE